MQTHVKVLGVLHIVFGAVLLLIGLAVFVIFGGIIGAVQLDNDPDAAAATSILGAVGGVMMVFFLALSLPGLIAGAGLLYFKGWARILGIVLSVLHLPGFPFGTALGVYGLWVLLTADGARAFQPDNVGGTLEYQK
jgi:hypothetical protein